MISAVIFDFDDTLERWSPAEAEADAQVASLAAKQYGLTQKAFLDAFNAAKAKYVHKTKRPIDMSRETWISTALHTLNADYDIPEVKSLEDAYWKKILEVSTLFPGTIEILQELSTQYTLCMFSDSDGYKPIKLERIKKLCIDQFFKKIVTSDDVFANKPDPAGWRLIMKQLQLRPQEIAMVGDHPEMDLLPAKQLGMKTIWTQEALQRDVHYPFVDKTILSIMALPDALKKL
ncbi:MAG: HAD family hydrolase [archaeon]